MTRLRRFVACGVLAAATACSDGTGPDDMGPAGLRVVAGAEVTDTISAVLRQALIVELRDESGRVVPNAEVRLQPATSGSNSAATAMLASLSSEEFRHFVTERTDARGQVAVLVRLGDRAGTATVAIEVPALGLTTTATYTVQAGAPSTVDAEPTDTVLYVGGNLALRGVVRDRGGNPTPDAVSYQVPDGVAPVALSGTMIRGERIGRGYVVATVGAAVDTAWVSVVPRGLIAAYEFPIYFNSNGPDIRQPGRIVLLQLDGSEYRVLLEQTPAVIPFGYSSGMHPRWMPSGNEITYVNAAQLWAVDMQGRTRLILSDPRANEEFAPEISGDGLWLYFTRATFGSDIWRVRTDGSQAQATNADGPRAAAPAPAPTGERFMYQTEFTTNGGLEPTLRLLDLASGIRTPLDVPGSTPKWSPTGEWIAYRDYSQRLRIVRPDGTERRFAGPEVRAHTDFAWSPDGQWLIISRDESSTLASTGVGLALVNVTTGQVLPVRLKHRLVHPTWRR